MNLLRWLLLLPATIGIWYAVFILSLFCYLYIDKNFCPAKDVISGMCYNDTIPLILSAVTYLGVGLSAMAVCVVATAIAPSHKIITAWITLALGTIVAGIMASTASLPLFIVAVAGGFFGVFAIKRYLFHLQISALEEAKKAIS